MKQMLTVMVLAIGLVVCGLASPAFGQDVDPKVVSQVETLLSGFEYVPTKADWDRVGPQAAVVLRKIAADTGAKKVQRARAISSLMFFPQSTTQTFLTSLIGEEGQPLVLRRKALRSLANGFGDRAIPTVEPFLSSKDAHLRKTAIKALGSIKTDKSRQLLQARLKVETSKVVKETIEKTLKKMNK